MLQNPHNRPQMLLIVDGRSGLIDRAAHMDGQVGQTENRASEIDQMGDGTVIAFASGYYLAGQG